MTAGMFSTGYNDGQRIIDAANREKIPVAALLADLDYARFPDLPKDDFLKKPFPDDWRTDDYTDVKNWIDRKVVPYAQTHEVELYSQQAELSPAASPASSDPPESRAGFFDNWPLLGPWLVKRRDHQG